MHGVEVHERIDKLLDNHLLTQKEIADRVGVSFSCVKYRAKQRKIVARRGRPPKSLEHLGQMELQDDLRGSSKPPREVGTYFCNGCNCLVFLNPCQVCFARNARNRKY